MTAEEADKCLDHFYNMDCMEGMKRFPDKYFDLAIVDPPYGISAPAANPGKHLNPSDKRILKGRLNSGGGKLKKTALQNMNCNWDFSPPDRFYFKELFRVSKNQIIFGGNYFPLPPTRGIGCWDKKQSWENFSQWEMIWTSFDCPAFMIRYMNRRRPDGERKIHPTQKPIYVYKKLLGKFSTSGDKILDTHVGSASSLIACWKMDRPFVGFEIDEQYYLSASARLEAAQAQQTLFRMEGHNVSQGS